MNARHLPSLIGIAVLGGLVAETAATARRASCGLRCGYRIAECVLARGGVDGGEQRRCRRLVVGNCRRRTPRVCPLPDRDELAATVAAVQAVEATVHESPLCAATLPDVPAATLDDALAVGRETAAVLANASDAGFQLRASYGARVFEKLFIQGTLGHGAAFVPLGAVVQAMARPARAVVYARSDPPAPLVYGIVGVMGGRAVGLLLTSCPSR